MRFAMAYPVNMRRRRPPNLNVGNRQSRRPGLQRYPSSTEGPHREINFRLFDCRSGVVGGAQ